MSPSSEEPNATQKLLFVCQSSVSLKEVGSTGTSLVTCSEGAKGEFDIDTFWQALQTVEQKFLADLFLFNVVDLQSTGTVRDPDSILNRSAEN